MSVDAGPIGRLAAELMELVEADYNGRGVELRAALVLVDLGVTQRDGEHWTHVRWHFGQAPAFDNKTGSSAYAAGIAAEALEGLTAGQDTDPEEDDVEEEGE